MPEGERRYLDALVRGVYAKRDLAPYQALTHDDVYFAVPLLKGQLSTREFVGGEVMTKPLKAHKAVDIDSIDAPVLTDPALVEMIADRGLDVANEDIRTPSEANH